MKFENLEKFVSKLEKITGDKWWIGPTSLTNNESFTRVQNSQSPIIECPLKDFGGLPQNQTLSLEDFKHYIKTSGRNLKHVKLVQETVLYHHNKQTNSSHFECLIRKEIPLNTKLDDKSLLIDNLDDFQWQYEWKKGYTSVIHCIPSYATVSITAKPSSKALEFLESQPLNRKELVSVVKHSEISGWLKNLADQALSNINNAAHSSSKSKKGTATREL